MLDRPPFYTDTIVYSNWTHEFDQATVAMLESEPSAFAMHAAWDFCGYVWRTPEGRWVEQIWRHHYQVGEVQAESIAEVVQLAAEMYGSL